MMSSGLVPPMSDSAREVLNEIKWRTGYDLSRAEIWVADRGRPEGERVLSGAEIVSLGRKYLTTATATIPFYKVRRIVYGEEILFDLRPPAPRKSPRRRDPSSHRR